MSSYLFRNNVHFVVNIKWNAFVQICPKLDHNALLVALNDHQRARSNSSYISCRKCTAGPLRAVQPVAPSAQFNQWCQTWGFPPEMRFSMSFWSFFRKFGTSKILPRSGDWRYDMIDFLLPNFMTSMTFLPHSSANVERIISQLNCMNTRTTSFFKADTVKNKTDYRLFGRQAITRKHQTCTSWSPNKKNFADVMGGTVGKKYKQKLKNENRNFPLILEEVRMRNNLL